MEINLSKIQYSTKTATLMENNNRTMKQKHRFGWPSWVAMAFLAGASLLGSCQEDGLVQVVPTSTTVSLTFRTPEGADLLDPSTPGGYDASALRVYYVRDGRLRMRYDASSQMPYGYRVDNQLNGLRVLTVLTDNCACDERVRTYLQFSPDDMDTLEVRYRWGEGYILKDSVWYNSVYRPIPAEGEPLAVLKQR